MSDTTTATPDLPPDRGKTATPSPSRLSTVIAVGQPQVTAPADGRGCAGQSDSLPPHPFARLAAEIAAGQGLTFAQAARAEPAYRGKRAWPTTFWRRVSKGVRAWDGAVVRLEAMRVGRRWLTTRAALARFYQRLTPTFPNEAPPSPPAGGGSRANAVLSRLGY